MSPPRSSPPPLLVLAGVLAAFAFAILAAAPIHAGLGAMISGLPFAKVFRYLLLVSLLCVFAWATKPWRQVPSDLWGLRGRPRLDLWARGVAIGVTLLVAIALLDAAAGHLSWDGAKGVSKLVKRLPTILTLLLVLAPIEEMFFRGWLFDRFAGRFSARTAHLSVAGVFAGIHAFRESDAPKNLSASAAGAVEVLAAWGRNLLDWRGFGPSFVGLFLLSLVLSAARRRWGTLWFSVGLHGAAAAWLHVHSSLTERSVERDWTGSKWLYDGVPGWAVLLTVLYLVARRPAAAPRAPVSSGDAPTTR